MIGDSKYEYQKYLNLKDLGIQLESREPLKARLTFIGKDAEKSFYQWCLVKIFEHSTSIRDAFGGNHAKIEHLDTRFFMLQVIMFFDRNLLFYTPSLGYLYHEEDYESDDYEGYQRR